MLEYLARVADAIIVSPFTIPLLGLIAAVMVVLHLVEKRSHRR